MKVLLSWLREFAPDIDGDPVGLGEKLSALGLAVAGPGVIAAIPAAPVALASCVAALIGITLLARAGSSRGAACTPTR